MLKRCQVKKTEVGYCRFPILFPSNGTSDYISKKRANRGTPPLHAVEALMVGLVGAREGDFKFLIILETVIQ